MNFLLSSTFQELSSVLYLVLLLVFRLGIFGVVSGVLKFLVFHDVVEGLTDMDCYFDHSITRVPPT